mgnify:CR=1 FL=1|tara:strand:+ start:7701 stop:8009 length:309 start_codon:yes stop_codon:yes gene_type:complete
MPTTFGQANIAFGGASFTFGEFSVAYELSLIKDGRASRKQLYDKMFQKDPVKKKKVIELILKVKGKTIKDNVKIPTDMDIALSNIDLVIQEVLHKPTARIYA